MPASATDHVTHDELLVARLFGDDLHGPERAAALDQVAACAECAALLADLGAIATATAALPVPPRPRDFALTEADAARLRGRPRGLGRLLGLGARQSFGGALVALGLTGVILSAALSVLSGGPAGTVAFGSGSGSKQLAPQVGIPASGGLSGGLSGVAVVSAAPQPASSTGSEETTDQSQAGVQAAASSPTTSAFGPATTTGTRATTAESSPALAVAAGGSPGGLSPGYHPPAQPGQDTSTQAIDWRSGALIASVAAFGVGWLILIAPPLLRRRARR
jgi:hypothetical protein